MRDGYTEVLTDARSPGRQGYNPSVEFTLEKSVIKALIAKASSLPLPWHDIRLESLIGVERFPADEAQLAVPDRDHGSRSRQPVDAGEFSNDRAWAKDRQYPPVALRRSDADLEQTLFKPIATIGDVSVGPPHLPR
jgi:hypothetical protein